jgi:hypothetical protein
VPGDYCHAYAKNNFCRHQGKGCTKKHSSLKALAEEMSRLEDFVAGDFVFNY